MVPARRFKPFDQLPRRRQRDAYVHVRNQIRAAAPILGGKFFTHHYLHGQNGWIDAWFVGHKAPRFYNLTLETTRCAYAEAVWEQAWEASCLLVAPEAEPRLLDRATRDPVSGHYVTVLGEPRRFPEFGDCTRMQWVQRQLRVIANTGSIHVLEHWSVHRDYAHGVGVHATIDVPWLSVDTVNAFIDRFMADESDYWDVRPLSYRYDEVAHWGNQANAVIDPSQWPVAVRRG
jgi:hypothetical protein